MFYMLHLKRFQSMEGVTTSGEIDVTCVLNRKRTKFCESFEKNYYQYQNLHDGIQSFLTFKCSYIRMKSILCLVTSCESTKILGMVHNVRRLGSFSK